MRTKILVLLSLVVVVAGASLYANGTAPETYSITISNQTQIDRLDMGRTQHNTDACRRGNLAVSCTQGDLCVALNVAGGSSCTNAAALAAGARIYGDNTNSRQWFITDQLIKAKLEDFAAEQRRRDLQSAREACAAFNQTQKNAVCTAYGLPSGCLICD